MMARSGRRVRLSEARTRQFHGLEIFSLSPARMGPFSALRITVAPRSHLPAIHHERMWEFFFVLKGAGYGRVGGRRVRFKAGSHVFIPPRVPHDFHAGPRGIEALVIFSPRFDPKRPDVVRA